MVLHARLLIFLGFSLLAFNLASCSGGGGSDNHGTPDPIVVVPETSAASSGLIDTTGGTISATGADSTIYGLSVPPASILDSERSVVTLTPVSDVKNLPSSASNIAAVQFAPDGLSFGEPATLTIKLPNVYDETRLLAYTFEGNGENMAFIPIESYDPATSTVTLSIYHFSGAGITLGDHMDLVAHPADPSSERYYRQQLAIIENEAQKAGQNAYFSPEYVEKISNVYINWFKSVLSGSMQDIADYDLEWTNELVKKYGMWLADLQETQCKINGGCGSGWTVPSCFASSGLSPRLDDIREYAADKFVAHFDASVEALSAQCVAKNDKCDKKALIEEALDWQELSQFGGVTADPCRDTGEPVQFYGYFCEDAAQSIVGSVVFSEGPAAMLQKGGQAIYELTAFDMFGEEIVYGGWAFGEVWPNLTVSWSTDNAQKLDAVDVTDRCSSLCTRSVLATARETGTANLIGTFSGDGVCDDPIEARLELTISPDTTPPNNHGSYGSEQINVDGGASVTIGVGADDGEYGDPDYGLFLSSGTGIDHAEFYKYNHDGTPGDLIGISPCAEDKCIFTFQVPACYGTSSTEWLVIGYGAIVVDKAGNRSNYASTKDIHYYGSDAGPCYP